jgi:D-alanine-D-alanine ligase-like ATP-grasp enzyme
MEIFGYDFILDHDLNPWLIEVNTNPCLEESSTLLQKLIPRMVDDALKLTLDQVFPPKRFK